MVVCGNCRGKKIFKNITCFCVYLSKNKTAKPGCKDCKGLGKHDNPCPVCKGLGKIQAEVTVSFINNASKKEISYTINAAALVPLAQKEEYINYRKDKAKEWIYRVKLEHFIQQACQEFGLDYDKTILHIKDEYVSNWQIFSTISSRTTPVALSEKQLQRDLRESLANHFAWSINHNKSNHFVFTLMPRRSSAELLQELTQKTAAQGFTFSLEMWEGNIATGESGWDVFLLNAKTGQRLSELTVEYESNLALHNALAKLDKAMAKATLALAKTN